MSNSGRSDKAQVTKTFFNLWPGMRYIKTFLCSFLALLADKNKKNIKTKLHFSTPFCIHNHVHIKCHPKFFSRHKSVMIHTQYENQ